MSRSVTSTQLSKSLSRIRSAVTSAARNIESALAISSQFPWDDLDNGVEGVEALLSAFENSHAIIPEDVDFLESKWRELRRTVKVAIVREAPDAVSSQPLLRLTEQVGQLQSHIARMEQDRAALDLKSVGEATRRAEAAEKRALDAAEAAERAAGRAAVASYSEFYQERASHHETQAKSWLIRTGISIGVLVVLTITFVALAIADIRPKSAEVATSIEFIGLRVLALSALAGLAYWASHQLRVHQHNSVVFRQKEAAVNTFQAFAKEAPDAETKRAVVLEASRSIYSIQDTGWNGDSNPAAYQPPLMQVITAAEVVRSAAQGQAVQAKNK